MRIFAVLWRKYRQQAEHWRKVAVATDEARIRVVGERDEYAAALREIASLETPACANIGRKMARIARGVLPEYADKPVKPTQSAATAR